MQTADLAFQHAANAAAAYAATTPAYVSYAVDSQITIPSMHRERKILVRETTRTADGRTLVTDLPGGRTHPESMAFPFAPNLDAISYFHLSYSMTMHGKASFEIDNVVPMTFAQTPQRTTDDSDVVVMSTRAYRVRYAPDSSNAPNGTTHLLLHPYAVTVANAPHASFFFSDVKVDNATGLPSQVSFTGTDDLAMSIDYGNAGGRLGVVHAHFEQTVHGPLRIGRVHFLSDATFHDVGYALTLPADQLARF